jgi:hypothetical protein
MSCGGTAEQARGRRCDGQQRPWSVGVPRHAATEVVTSPRTEEPLRAGTRARAGDHGNHMMHPRGALS